jgi:hypothetical protein
MSSPETLTPVATTRRATEGTPYSPVYGVETCLPPKTVLDSPQVQSLCRSGCSVRIWAPSVNADGNPRLGPSPMASTKPRRVS